MTPLHFAVQLRPALAAIEALLDAGADPKARGRERAESRSTGIDEEPAAEEHWMPTGASMSCASTDRGRHRRVLASDQARPAGPALIAPLFGTRRGEGEPI